jgi:alpha-tubulin suppressor-like RCC1 family protein
MSRQAGLSFWVVVGSLALSAACGGPSIGEPIGVGDGGPGVTPNNVDTRPSDVSVPEAPIDFGLGDCGGAAPPEKTIKITNAGGGTVTWTAELEADGFTIIGATTGAFSGSGSVNVKVRAKPIPSSAVAGAESRATLLVVIDRTKIFRVPLRVTAQGGTLELVPGDAAFGEMPINVQAPDVAVGIKNVGNKAVSVRVGDPSLTDFKFNYSGAPAAVTVAPGASIVGAVARFRPSKLTMQTTSAPITVQGAVCGKSATAVTMSGAGSGGVVGISPGQLDFPKTDCGGRANPLTLTILNDGNASFSFTAALGKGAGSAFQLSASAGIVPAKSLFQLAVNPNAIPPTSAITDNLYGDILTITTNAANDSPHAVPLIMGAKGAILAFSASPTDYGTRDMFSAALGKTASIANTGNAPATVTVASSTTAYSPDPAVATAINAGAALNVMVNFAPTVFGDNNANLSLSVSGATVLCQPLPAAISLTGKGKGVASNVGVGSIGRNTERSSSACAVLTGAPGNVGHVACWGDNQFGQLGQGSAIPNQAPTPVVIPSFSGAVAVAGSGEHNCARMTNGTVYCWGRNTNSRTPPRVTGQLGSGGADKSVPTLVPGVTNVISLSAAERHTCAVSTVNVGDASGKVICWGTNKRGNLGTGTISDSSGPVQVSGITDALTVSVSGFGGCARRVGNVVSCWGQQNAKGNLGNGVTTTNTTGAPVPVSGLSTAVFLAAGGGGGRTGISCVAENTGNVLCWGDNNGRPLPTIGKINGAVLANTSSNPLPAPVAVPGVSGATAVTAGRQHMCAIVANGAVKCWGRGPNGQLGNGTNVSASAQVDATGLLGVTQLSSQRDFNCALLSTGAVMCWGQNTFSQLGNPAAGTPQTTPILVSGF